MNRVWRAPAVAALACGLMGVTVPVAVAAEWPLVAQAETTEGRDDYQVGETIEAWHSGNGPATWMKSTILEIRDGKYKIHYGGSRYNTTWITIDRIKGSKTQLAKAAADSIPNVAIQAVRDLEYKIGQVDKVRNSPNSDEKKAAAQSLMWESAHLLGKLTGHPKAADVQDRFWSAAVWGFDVYLAAMQGMIGGKTVQNINWVKAEGAGGNMVKNAGEILKAYKAYAGADAATVSRMEADLAKADSFRGAKEQQVEEEKMAKRQMPKDNYSGGDAGTIRNMITSSWRKQYPNLPILAVRLDGRWERDAGWNRTTTNSYWSDRYVMYASVVCKTDARVATVYPILVARDNIKRGLLEVKVTDHGINSYVPSRMLLKNVK